MESCRSRVSHRNVASTSASAAREPANSLGPFLVAGEQRQRQLPSGKFWHWNYATEAEPRNNNVHGARQTTLQGQQLCAFLAGNHRAEARAEAGLEAPACGRDGSTTTRQECFQPATRQQQQQHHHHDTFKSANQFEYCTRSAQQSTSRGWPAADVISAGIAREREQEQLYEQSSGAGHHYAMHSSNLENAGGPNAAELIWERGKAEVGSKQEVESGSSMVLVSEKSLNNLTKQVALSLMKMRDLEEQVRVIPEMRKKLDSVTSASNSIKSFDAITKIQSPIAAAASGSEENNSGQSHNSIGTNFSNKQTNNPSLAALSKHNNQCNRTINDHQPGEMLNNANCNSAQETTCFVHDVLRATPTRVVRDTRSPLVSLATPSTSPARHHHHHNAGLHLSSTSSDAMDQHNPQGFSRQLNQNNGRLSFNNNMPSSNLLITSIPLKTQLDCGCQSFKDHLRYNSISREQRLCQSNKAPHLITTTSTSNNNNNSPLHRSNNHEQIPISKSDASTMTDLSMTDFVARDEYDSMILNIHKNYSTLSIYGQSSARGETMLEKYSTDANKAFQDSLGSQSSSSSSLSGPKTYSRSSQDSRPEQHKRSAGVEDELQFQYNDEVDESIGSSDTSNQCVVDDQEEQDTRDQGLSEEVSLNEEKEEEENDDDDETQQDSASSQEDEPYSLGSSYPSDFEYYDQSLERRTTDFMSKSMKIPNNLRFALMRLNEFLKDRQVQQTSIFETSSSTSTSGHSFSSSSSAGCIRIIQENWFEVTTKKDSQVARAKLYIDYFQSFTKQLLNTIINLVDASGNSAIHYAASHFRLDIIKLLLDTVVCDVNCKNKAGYTPIMLLALKDINQPEDQEVARLLFSVGDVNIKARSSGQTALMLAATNGNANTCQLLLDCGADPSLQDNEGSTALMAGTELGHEKVVRCLLAHKLTDPTALDNDGLDAMTIAMNNGHEKIALLLYSAKNVPKTTLRPSPSHLIKSITPNKNQQNKPLPSPNSPYLAASLRRTRTKMADDYVRRTDSLSKSRIARLVN